MSTLILTPVSPNKLQPLRLGFFLVCSGLPKSAFCCTPGEVKAWPSQWAPIPHNRDPLRCPTDGLQDPKGEPEYTGVPSGAKGIDLKTQQLDLSTQGLELREPSDGVEDPGGGPEDPGEAWPGQAWPGLALPGQDNRLASGNYKEYMSCCLLCFSAQNHTQAQSREGVA